MKNPFAQYPKVFYQIVLLFLVCQICYSWFSSIVNPFEYSDFFVGKTNLITPISLIVSLLYILSGYIVIRVIDFTKGLKIGTGLLLAGSISIFVFQDSTIGFFISISLLRIGHGIIYIFCIMHVAILFPIANDWKDNAFMILIMVSIIFSSLLFQFVFIIFEILFTLDSFKTFDPNVVGIGFGLGFIALLYLLINRFKNLGFEVQNTTEDSEPSEGAHKANSFVRSVMIGVILVATIFSFLLNNLNEFKILKISSYAGSGLSYLTYFSGITYIIFSVVMGILIFRSQYHSSQIKKVIYICISIFFLIILKMVFETDETGGMQGKVMLINFLYPFLLSFLLMPILFSIMTHINLEKNLGLWLGVLISAPQVVNKLENFLYKTDLIDYFPYVAMVIFVVFFIWLRENRSLLEENLALNEPNQIEDEDDELDILEHFVEE